MIRLRGERILAKQDFHLPLSRILNTIQLTPRRIVGALGIATLLVTPAAYALQSQVKQPSDSEKSQTNPLPASNSFEIVEDAPSTDGSNSNDQTIEVEVNSQNNGSHESSRSVRVNGQQMEMPESGTVKQTITNEDGGSSSVHLEQHNTSTNDNNNSTTVIIESYSSSSSDNGSKEGDPYRGRHRQR